MTQNDNQDTANDVHTKEGIHKVWQYVKNGQAVVPLLTGIIRKGTHFIFCICCTLLTWRVLECN